MKTEVFKCCWYLTVSPSTDTYRWKQMEPQKLSWDWPPVGRKGMIPGVRVGVLGCDPSAFILPAGQHPEGPGPTVNDEHVWEWSPEGKIWSPWRKALVIQEGREAEKGDSRWLSEGVTCSPPYRWPPLPSSRDTKITWGTAIYFFHQISEEGNM